LRDAPGQQGNKKKSGLKFDNSTEEAETLMKGSRFAHQFERE
jgi:hypothetical protein